MTQVTQADRDAAADFACSAAGATDRDHQISECRAGKHDETFIVQAFAAHRIASQADGFTQHGMDLRDWFAGQALAGMASIALDDGDMIMGWADMSKAAYKAADAMLAERSKS